MLIDSCLIVQMTVLAVDHLNAAASEDSRRGELAYLMPTVSDETLHMMSLSWASGLSKGRAVPGNDGVGEYGDFRFLDSAALRSE